MNRTATCPVIEQNLTLVNLTLVYNAKKVHKNNRTIVSYRSSLL